MVKVVRKVDLYEKLLAKYKEIILLRNVSGQIQWDFEVMMPKKGAQQRAEELSLMSGLIHKRSTDPKIGSLLKEIKLALEDAGRKFRRFITRRETARRKAKRAGILAMYADQFAESLTSIVNDAAGKDVFDAETIAGKIRDSITGFETVEDF